MKNLITKNVPFEGTKLLAVQNKDTGKIYASINSILRELGFDDRQVEYRRNKWIADKVLGKGVQKILYPSKDGGVQETYCIEIKRLPIALAKIEVTPKMGKVMPHLSKKLEKYQEQCADVLADAFLDNQQTPLTLQQQIQTIAKGTDELYQRVGTLEERFIKFEDELPVTGADMEDIQSAVRKKGVEVLGGKDSNAYHDNSTRAYVYADIQCELRRQFGVRKYKEIKHKETPDALRIINGYKLPIALKTQVDMMNAQQSLNLE